MSVLSYHTKQCQALGKWSRMQVNAVPKLKNLIYIPMDGKRTPAAGGIMKSMGMRKGVWDYFLAAPRYQVLWRTPEGATFAEAHGLWIEMKSEDDELSDEQKWWGELMRAAGYPTVVCRTWIAARDNILDYLGVKHTPSTKQGKQWRT